MKIDFYKNLLKDSSKKITALQKQSDNFSLIRLSIAIAVLALATLGYFYQNSIFYFLAVCAILFFAVIVKKQNKTDDDRQYYIAQEIIVDKYVKRFTNDWHSFTNNGEQYLKEDFPQARDLDIFGKGSLYQYICVANTEHGQNILAQQLQNLSPQKNTIIQYQNAVKELAQSREFSLKIQTLTQLLLNKQSKQKLHSIDKFIQQVEYPQEKTSFIKQLFLYVFPFATIGFTVSAFLYAGNNILSLVSTSCIITQLVFCAFSLQKNNAILQPVYSFCQNITAYKELFKQIEQAEFNSSLLKELQSKIALNGGALNNLGKLNIINEAVALRYNAVASLLFNSFLLWDFHCVHRFHQWKNSYGKNIRLWLDTISELEMLLSLAVICNIKEEYTFANIVDSNTPNISFSGINHPLIQEEKVVSNSLEIQNKTYIITGSNMSGKTTFMRSIGLNLVLTYAGAPTTATGFTTCCMAIFTSIRIEDSVSDGISSFYAELLRIKQMIDYHKTQSPMLLLIDEIFKGTNSADRIICAQQTIKQLSAPHSITIVTTHDFELCDLEHDENINALNYHFAEYYVDDKIQFDYKIKPNRCKTTNAQHLLKMVGI